MSNTALILGGSSGIGYATALRFAKGGTKVAITSRNLEKAEVASATLSKLGYEAMPLKVDVCSSDSISLGVDSLVKHWGKLDFAFNNAGWEGEPGPIDELSEISWTKMIDIKLSGVWRGMKVQLKQMKIQGYGSVVNMAGSWGLDGFPNFASYCAAAHGIVGLSRAAAKEIALLGIRINCVCPGAVEAPMLDRMVGGDQSMKDSFANQLAVKRLCSPEEVAEAVTWLCSDSASYINGTTLTLDGSGY